MGNEVTSKQYLNNDDYYAAIAGEAATMTGGGGGKAFLKFNGDDGEYSYGADDTELSLQSQLVMNPGSFKRGYAIWKDSKVVHESMLSVLEGLPPSIQSLPDFGPYKKSEGPTEQQTIEFATTEEPFIEMIFQANNVSKRRAMAALMKDWGGQYKLNKGKWPIVEIDEREFDIEVDGRKVKKHAPAFKIVAWVTEEDLASMKGENPADYEEETAPQPVEQPKPAAIEAKPDKKTRARGRF